MAQRTSGANLATIHGVDSQEFLKSLQDPVDQYLSAVEKRAPLYIPMPADAVLPQTPRGIPLKTALLRGEPM